MLRTSIQNAVIFNDENFDEGLKLISEAGFECIDFNIDEYLPSGQISSNKKEGLFAKSTEEVVNHFEPLLHSLEKHNVSVGQMHAPFPAYIYENDEMNPFLHESVVKSMAVCQYLKCPYLIVHPISLANQYGVEEERRVNLAFYRSFIPYAKAYGVKICLENAFHVAAGKIREGACSNFHEAVYYIDTLNAEAGEECFAFCLDIGHATILGKNLWESVHVLGKRLQTLHIHDNDGIEDLHMLPYTYAKNWGLYTVTEWEGLLKGLYEIGYSGTISFETYRVSYNFPEELRFPALKFQHEIAAYFAKRVSRA